MTAEKRTVFVADDGSMFMNRAECERHEGLCDTMKHAELADRKECLGHLSFLKMSTLPLMTLAYENAKENLAKKRRMPLQEAGGYKGMEDAYRYVRQAKELLDQAIEDYRVKKAKCALVWHRFHPETRLRKAERAEKAKLWRERNGIA